MNTEQIVKSTQEQAIAAWVNYLNQVRLDKLSETLSIIGQNQAEELSHQAQNLSDALSSIDEAICNVNLIIESNRGGPTGIHGYIAEAAQVGIGNAQSQIQGGSAIYNWSNNNGQWDIVRRIAGNGTETPIQMKFVQKNLSLDSLLKHLEDYPDSLEIGGKYQIPKDFYERIQMYLEMPENVANKVPTSTGEFSLKEWKYIHQFFDDGKIPIERIEASDLTYQEVQAGRIHSTLSSEKDILDNLNKEKTNQIKEVAKKQSKEAYLRSKPSFSEGTKASVVSAAVEGTTALCTAIIKKRKTGKKLFEFTVDDWMEIGGESVIGTLKGGIRGATIYAFTNYTATPAAVANSLATASFSLAEQINRFRKGNITEIQLLENSEIVCLDTAISALSSIIGQVAIPIPVLGTVIGNAVGSMMYQIAKNSFEKNEQDILHAYLTDLENLRKDLDTEYVCFTATLNDEFMKYLTLVNNAFSSNTYTSFMGSIELAKSLGVDENEIVTSNEDIENYFLS